MAEASPGMRRPMRLTGCMQERRGTLAPMSFSTAVGLTAVGFTAEASTAVGLMVVVSMAEASTAAGATAVEATEGGDKGQPFAR